MKQAEVSVIIPVYNSEKYLPECIESIRRQNFQNIEILLVDDGSTDRSSDICDVFANKDQRIKVIHKKNGGVSAARNTGIDAARGKYLIFVDSDDYLDTECIQTLYDAISKEDIIDCVFCGLRYVYEETNQKTEYLLPEVTIRSEKEFNKYYLKIRQKFGFYTACAKIYKKKIIEQYNVRFNEKLAVFEDGTFTWNYLERCNVFSCVEKAMYNYRQYSSESLLKRFNENAPDALQIKFKEEEYLRNRLQDENLKSYYLDFFEAWFAQAEQIYGRFEGSNQQRLEKLKILAKLSCLKLTLNYVDTSQLSVKRKMIVFFLKHRQYKALHILFRMRYTEKNGESKENI